MQCLNTMVYICVFHYVGFNYERFAIPCCAPPQAGELRMMGVGLRASRVRLIVAPAVLVSKKATAQPDRLHFSDW